MNISDKKPGNEDFMYPPATEDDKNKNKMDDLEKASVIQPPNKEKV